MRQTPLEQFDSFRIGTIEFVSPDNIEVALDLEAPTSMALNTGAPRLFPRVNGYLLIPVDEVYLVGQVEWITIRHSAFPKRQGMRDFGLLDLPFPQRRLRLNPLGTLAATSTHGDYVFQRGAAALPSIGAPVLLPTDSQLRAIVQSTDEVRVTIGVSPLAGDAAVSIDPNRLFGRHLAVLGNTGSGKSCTVAGLVRWSLENSKIAHGNDPNARFIILDPNGEYSRAFQDDDTIEAKIFKVDNDTASHPLRVPLWFWTSAEWATFMQASARAQRPLLRRALREVKAGRQSIPEGSTEENLLKLRRFLSSRLHSIASSLRSGEIFAEESKFGFRLKALAADLETKASAFPEHDLSPTTNAIADALSTTHNSFVNNSGETVEYYRAFTEHSVTDIVERIQDLLASLGGVILNDGPDEDMPIPFNGADLADHLEQIALQEGAAQYIDPLVARIRALLSDSRIQRIIEGDHDITLQQWLEDYFGMSDSEASERCVSIIDLSLVPSDVTHVVTSVIVRMLFEALQRHIKSTGTSLPTVLIVEEAHAFVRRYREDSDSQDASIVCCQTLERVAREGRKFGLGLVLSSQRPSELSPAVLSQCNTFLLHRISNDRDQDLVLRLVPDNLRGLLRELPLLPTQRAIILGWASELPVLVHVRSLPKEHQPRSDDPEFWKVWTGEEDRKTDWTAVAEEWQGNDAQSASSNAEVVEPEE